METNTVAIRRNNIGKPSPIAEIRRSPEIITAEAALPSTFVAGGVDSYS